MTTSAPDLRDARLDAQRRLVSQYVLVSELSEKLGMKDSNTLAMRLKRKGYALVRVPNPRTGHPTSAVTVMDAKRIYNEERQKPQVVSLEEVLGERG